MTFELDDNGMLPEGAIDCSMLYRMVCGNHAAYTEVQNALAKTGYMYLIEYDCWYPRSHFAKETEKQAQARAAIDLYKAETERLKKINEADPKAAIPLIRDMLARAVGKSE